MANAYPNCEVVGIDLVCPGVGDGNLPQNCNFRTVNGKFSCLLDYKRFQTNVTVLKVLDSLPFDSESFDYIFIRNMTVCKMRYKNV